MAFPTTPILDNFNRSNVGPPPSGSWSACYSGYPGQFEVISNQMTVDSLGAVNACGNYWNPATYTNTEAYITIVTLPASSYCDLSIRVPSPGGTVWDGYLMEANSSNATTVLYRMDDSVVTELSNLMQNPASGCSIGVSMIGSSIQPYYKASGGSWGVLGSPVVDATYSAAGYLALSASSLSYVFDDFGGGACVVSAIKTVQGLAKASVKTVQGLSIVSVKSVQGLT